MEKLSILNHDPQDNGAQYLEDLATGYWFSQTLFTAVEMEIFTRLEPSGKTLSELAVVLQIDLGGLKRFLRYTCNGRVYPAAWVQDELKKLGLVSTDMLSLESDTALVIAAGNQERLADLCLDKKSQLAARIRRLGFRNVYQIAADMVHVPDWTPMHCRFGCSSFGQPHCPPHSPSPEETRSMLLDYTACLILEGDPPTGGFQRQVLRAEKEAFRSGFYKAFAFWAGPCSICKECSGDLPCKNTKEARPSMEASGIDVFETVRRAGIPLRTIAEGDDFVKYFAILLLE